MFTNVKRDPRREKLRDFRKTGHCSCQLCKWHKVPCNDEIRKERKRLRAVLRTGSQGLAG